MELGMWRSKNRIELGRIKREGKNKIEREAFLKEQAGKEEGGGFAPEEKKREDKKSLQQQVLLLILKSP